MVYSNKIMRLIYIKKENLFAVNFIDLLLHIKRDKYISINFSYFYPDMYLRRMSRKV